MSGTITSEPNVLFATKQQQTYALVAQIIIQDGEHAVHLGTRYLGICANTAIERSSNETLSP